MTRIPFASDNRQAELRLPAEASAVLCAARAAALSTGCVAAAALTCALAAGPLRAQVAAHPPLSVSGTVVQEDGAPAAGVDVVLRPYPTAREMRLHDLNGPGALPQAADGVRTDADGGFRLSAPAVGTYRLEVRLGEAGRAPSVVVPLLYCSLLPLTAPAVMGVLELPAFHPLTIRAEDAAGELIPGALVFADPVGEQPPCHARFGSHERLQPLHLRFRRGSARTDAEGLARFLMPTVRSSVVVSAPGQALGGGRVESSRVTFRLERDVGTVLRVRDSAGDPAPATLIGMGDEPGVPLALTDERGEAVVGVAVGRETVLDFEAADQSFARVPARTRKYADGAVDDRIVDVRLERPTTVYGLILDAVSGQAIPDAAMWVSTDPGRSARADQFGILKVLTPLDGVDLGVAAAGYVSTTVRITAAQVQNAAPVHIGLMPAAPLWGLVVDGLGQPVPGARIRAEPSGKGPFAGQGSGGSGRATSGSDGSFWIATAVYGNPYRLTVEAQGYASSIRKLPALERGGEGAPVRIVVTKGRQPWGTVLDPAGAPVAGAQARLLWPAEFPQLEASDFAAEATGAVVSNARGEFEFRHVSPGPYGVRITHPEYVDLRWKGANVPHGDGYADLGVFTLTPGAEIRGMVTGPNRRPVGGAEVGLRQRVRGLSGQTRSVLTDGDGGFRLSGLLPGLVELSVVADGYAPRVLESVRPSTGEPILIELSGGASLVGTVRKQAGGAAPDVTVVLFAREMIHSALPTENLVRRAGTDSDGSFRLENVLPGVWSVKAVDDVGRIATERVELTPGELREIELRLRDADTLTVLVTNQLDRPVARAKVRVRPEGGASRDAFGSTDASGRVSLQVVAGAATVEVSHPGLPTGTRNVVLGRGVNDLHMQLDSGWEISGVVRAVDGAPVPGATVEAGRDPGFAEGSELAARALAYSRLVESRHRAVSDVNGGFRLTGLDRGRYHLTARLPGYSAHGAAAPIEIDGQSIAGVVIELEPETSIRGTVTGVEPAEMATVEVRAWRGVLFRSASPDFQGNFELEALAAGDWRIQAASDERRSLERTVRLDVGGANGFVELRFAPGFRLTGRVLVEGAPLSGGFVSASAAASGEKIERRARTDRQGRFEIAGLPAGTYRLRVRHESGVAEERLLDLQSDYYNLLIDLQPARPSGK